MDDKALVERLMEFEKFIRGQGALDGAWFGDTRSDFKGAFWWRRFSPIKEAADTIETQAEEKKALQSRIEALEAALRETMSRCTDCGGRGSFVKHDEVTDRDLWESCASCAVGYAALESQP